MFYYFVFDMDSNWIVYVDIDYCVEVSGTLYGPSVHQILLVEHPKKYSC